MASSPRPDAAMQYEESRLAVLHSLRLLDSEPELEFDSLVAMTAQMLECPTAMLSLIDRDRQWVKARIGTDMTETSRSVAFCDHTIRSPETMIVADATCDPRFVDNALVTRPGGIRFYAGAPVYAQDDEGVARPIGALCIIHDQPRTLGSREAQALANLAAIATSMIAARRTASDAIALAVRSERLAADLARKDQIFRQAERMAGIGWWRVDAVTQQVEWSEGVFRIHGLPKGDAPSVEAALDHYPGPTRMVLAQALANTMATGVPIDLEIDFVDAHGVPRRVRTVGEREGHDADSAVVGVFQDITERHDLETALRRSAETDPLTGLANRIAFERELIDAMAHARRTATPLLLALIDLDGFKAINDTLGHTAGDDVLRKVGAALRAPWLAGSLAARLGGDEFALIVTHPGLTSTPARLREELHRALFVEAEADGIVLMAGGSVGFATLSAEHRTTRDFVRAGDADLYAAKRLRQGDRRRAVR